MGWDCTHDMVYCDREGECPSLVCAVRGFFDKGCLFKIRDPARAGIATVRGMRKEIALSESRPAPAHNPTGYPAIL